MSSVVAPGWLRRVLFMASVLLTVASIVVLLVAMPEGSTVSSDPVAPTLSYAAIIGPSLVGIAVTLALPWRAVPMPVVPVKRRRLVVTTAGLIVLLAVFVLATVVVPLQGEDYVLGKFVLLILVPAMLLLVVRRSVKINVRRGAWRWWAPLVVLAIWFYLSQLAPWNPPYDPGDIDISVLIVAAVATAITASVGEELFFRRWLQTRVEAMVGAGAGIGITSVLFGLMHLGSHGTGELWLDVARVIAIQGTFGWFMGVLWWRYRNLAAVILAHLISNGWGVVVYLVVER